MLLQWAFTVPVDNVQIGENGVMIFETVNWGIRREAFHSGRFSVRDFTYIQEN
jgi:hypothetical protein